jgi:UDP-N-acetylmuramoylalanine-D-glutamate ligase
VALAAAYGDAAGMAPLARPDLPSGPFAVAGLRRAGIAATEALCRLAGSAEVVAFDRNGSNVPRRVRRRLRGAGIQVRLGPSTDALDFVPAPRALVKSPGISYDAPAIRLARRRGIPVFDELELGWRISRAPILGVTGTNGKSTVVGLATAVLAASGRAVSHAGNTELGPPLSAVGPGLDWIVCEVSSFQLEGCPALMPEVAVFTNLTHDHLVRHGTMVRYGQLKRRLFVRGKSAVPLAVIDVVDEFGRMLADDVQALGGRVVRVGRGPEADYGVAGARWDLRSSIVKLRTPTGPLELETRLPGVHNARNVATVVALSDLFGIERALLAETLATQAAPPGRLEVLDFGQPYELVLDSAVSPDAVEQVLLAIRSTRRPGGRIHAVLGIFGSPDSEHQRAIGAIARALSDTLILTSGSLRQDPPSHAIEGLAAGARAGTGGAIDVVRQRRDAIRSAMIRARQGDVVLVLGRGDVSEPVSDNHIDDRTVLRELATCDCC